MMKIRKDVLIVLDSYEYQAREKEFASLLQDLVQPHFFYSKYENSLTEKFAKTKYIGGFMLHVSYWMLSFLYACRLIGKRYNRFDTIVFVNPIVGIFYCMLCRLFFLNKKITIGGFLFENKSSSIYYSVRKSFVNFCYKKVSKLFVYGENEVSYYQTVFPKLKNKFEYVKYGRDFSYKNTKDFVYSNPYIASGGRSNRKFETLCDAMELLNQEGMNIDCVVATRPECVNSEMQKSKVKFVYGITLNQFGSFIEHSVLFVLPLLNIKLSAGHMAMLEAMSKGKPVIVTDIPAIRDYVSENEVIFYNPDDARDLANKINYIYKNLTSEDVESKRQKAMFLYNNEYSFKALLKRIVNQSII